MLTWTLGGYPSPTVHMIADFVEQKEDFHLEKWYHHYYGENAEKVQKAVALFCEAFREYPFSIQSLYLSPKTLGAANLWSLQPEEKSSTMVCYAFDDYQSWITPYPYEVYISQYEKLLKGWGQGCVELEKMPNSAALNELKIFAKVAYLHFEADVLQTKFSYHKKQGANADLLPIVERAKAATEELLALVRACPYVGFEASNHYYYNERNLLEKIVNLEQMEKSLA